MKVRQDSLRGSGTAMLGLLLLFTGCDRSSPSQTDTPAIHQAGQDPECLSGVATAEF